MNNEKLIMVKVNGELLEGNENEKIVDFLNRHGVSVPRFCHHQRLEGNNNCLSCMVEIDRPEWDEASLKPACHHHIERGLIINTETQDILDYRRSLYQLVEYKSHLPIHERDFLKLSEMARMNRSVIPGKGLLENDPIGKIVPLDVDEKSFFDSGACLNCGLCLDYQSQNHLKDVFVFDDTAGEIKVDSLIDESSYWKNLAHLCPTSAIMMPVHRGKEQSYYEVKGNCFDCSEKCEVVIGFGGSGNWCYQRSDEFGEKWACDHSYQNFDFKIDNENNLPNLIKEDTWIDFSESILNRYLVSQFRMICSEQLNPRWAKILSIVPKHHLKEMITIPCEVDELFPGKLEKNTSDFVKMTPSNKEMINFILLPENPMLVSRYLSDLDALDLPGKKILVGPFLPTDWMNHFSGLIYAHSEQGYQALINLGHEKEMRRDFFHFLEDLFL